MRVDLFTKETYLKLLKQHMKPKNVCFYFGLFKKTKVCNNLS